ncbi:MAG: peroxiredoxin [Parcubacteria group bacterium CG10_big_fil_rev_8_21_14_0_10_36_14]|nr:MAG: peroxiredoxin [Parcubacteria group bacterium CG10_big_fil_rev_8_21_14_0_10_36_14]
MEEKKYSIGENIQDMEFEIFYNKDIKKAHFSDYKGKWLILFFYPADFTFVCPTELREMAELYPQFQNEGTEIVSVSTDTAFVHKAWHDDSEAIKQVNFPMAADPTGKMCRAFGTYIEDEGLSLRGSFLIDPDGVIKACEIHDNSIGRNAKELLRKLQAAKFVREHGDKVCPASWHPGGDTLTPGIDLIGKI